VGANTVRLDDPALTARLDDIVLEPLRVVLGHAPEDARVRPCLELSGDLGAVLEELGRRDVLQLLVEGGPTTTSAFLEAGLVNHVVWYQAAAFAGGEGTLSALQGLSTPTMEALRRGRITDLRRLGDDVRIDVEV
jgi:diaminohydroxyphosphoribosylaminopyrimidine deaminase/5-amino-6-(5-phosphoribosylamino)uracil reductase